MTAFSLPRLRCWHPAVAMVLFTGLLGGCHRGPSVVPVTGTISYEGKPLEGATVMFVPQGDSSGTLLAFGQTDAEGRFRLRTNVGSKASHDGAVPGEYRVAISKYVPPRGMSEADYEKKIAAAEHQIYSENSAVPAKVELLSKYADTKKSTLSASVAAAGGNDFGFRLPQ
jgi:hypothetical protein